MTRPFERSMQLGLPVWRVPRFDQDLLCMLFSTMELWLETSLQFMAADENVRNNHLDGGGVSWTSLDTTLHSV
eukprot:1451523-Pyramimonas_sp.AAC.1